MLDTHDLATDSVNWTRLPLAKATVGYKITWKAERFSNDPLLSSCIT
jgi:hypothetical protein